MRQQKEASKGNTAAFQSMQEQITHEVRVLFRNAPCSDYIHHLNLAVSYSMKEVATEMGPESTNEVAFFATRIVTFLARLKEITSEARAEMYQGGMLPMEGHDII